MRFKNLNLGKRMTLAFGLIFILLAVNTAVTTYMLITIGKDADHVSGESLPFALTAGEMSRQVTEVQQWLTDVSATHNKDGYTELSAISGQMSATSEQTAGKANTVASAAEEMSANMNTVAAAVEQASSNTNMIASSAEQMSASINEIAQNSEKARLITGGAVSQAKNSAERVAQLGDAAREISKVTETITDTEFINICHFW